MSAVNDNTSYRRPKLVPTPDKSRDALWTRLPWRRIALYSILCLGFFLMGALPMWFKARRNANEREAAQHELRLSQLHNRLATAVIDARGGDYEPARQTASEFFTSLRNQVDRGSSSDLSETQREGCQRLLSERDHIITLLARNDPAAADQLANIYADYRKIMTDISDAAHRT